MSKKAEHLPQRKRRPCSHSPNLLPGDVSWHLALINIRGLFLFSGHQHFGSLFRSSLGNAAGFGSRILAVAISYLSCIASGQVVILKRNQNHPSAWNVRRGLVRGAFCGEWEAKAVVGIDVGCGDTCATQHCQGEQRWCHYSTGCLLKGRFAVRSGALNAAHSLLCCGWFWVLPCDKFSEWLSCGDTQHSKTLFATAGVATP